MLQSQVLLVAYKSPEALLVFRIWLLRIDWMHVHDREAVQTGHGTKVNGLYVEGNTEIAGRHSGLENFMGSREIKQSNTHERFSLAVIRAPNLDTCRSLGEVRAGTRF